MNNLGKIVNSLFQDYMILLLILLSYGACMCAGSDTILPGQFISRNQTLISAGGVFELGFFSPGNSHNYYIGIWYKKLQNKTVVWVANRKQPISNPSSATFRLLENGNLVLLNQSETAIWSTNSFSSSHNSSAATLLDNGNLVIRDMSRNSSYSVIIWQTFDHPTDTWLPGGKLGYNNLTKEKHVLTCWRSPENPAPALFSLEVEQNGTSHLLLWNESIKYWTSGYWTGKYFSLVPEIQLNYYVTNITYISNENESYFTYDSAIPSAYTRFVIGYTGQLMQLVWGQGYQSWQLFWKRPAGQCEVHGFCGAFSVCNQQKTPLCECLEGFEPTKPKDWRLEDHSDGCVRKTPLQCNNNSDSMFLKMSNVRLPDSSISRMVENVEECELYCTRNCSCNSYSYDNQLCSIWIGELFNLQQFSSSDQKPGKELRLRLLESDDDQSAKTSAKENGNVTWIIAGTAAGLFLLLGLVSVIVRRRNLGIALESEEDSLVLFKYKDLKTATKNFTEKIGEGGFGSVFKGTLPNSTPVAVKSLKNLKQSDKQFRSEVRTIGTIQHINLVRLRGFCVHDTRRFLVYDYMPNGSLEYALFQKSPKMLDWKTRYHRIVIGIAKGLAYLHEACRDCIIHCDIKPENILLDSEYNPKVADFGLAKLMGRDFSRVLTTMKGTRGYLAPEWISGEAITPKADVFSYGMLLFEVVSGRRNYSELLGDGGYENYFPCRVANVINRGEDVFQLLDCDCGLEGKSEEAEELRRACKVACWCTQDYEKDRPSMGQIVQILEGVLEVNVPPIPRWMKRLTEIPVDGGNYEEGTSSSVMFA